MKRSISALLFGIALLMLACLSESRAQSGANPPSKQDATPNDLLNEVRLLRITLQQISVNTYRGQVMVERLRLQQDQVNRLSQEFNATKNHIIDLRSEQINVKSRLDEAEKQREAGITGESQIARYKEMLESFKRTEEGLVERESQLSTQLEEEKANLNDLNKRLDALEREMIVKSQASEIPKK